MKKYIINLLKQADKLSTLAEWHGKITDKGLKYELEAIRLYDKAERLSVTHRLPA